MRNDDNEPSEQMKEYIAAEGLDMFMCSLEKYESLLTETGFEVLSLNDRNKWYLEKVKTEISDRKGRLYDDFVNVIVRLDFFSKSGLYLQLLIATED